MMVMWLGYGHNDMVFFYYRDEDAGDLDMQPV